MNLREESFKCTWGNVAQQEKKISEESAQKAVKSVSSDI